MNSPTHEPRVHRAIGGRVSLAPCYRFGDFELRPHERTLLRGGERVAIGSRAFDLLRVLVERRERSVPAEELQAAVWPNVVVATNNLHVQVWHLRTLLGADAIVNHPRIGYRLVPEVTVDMMPIGAPPAGAIERDMPTLAALDREARLRTVAETLLARRELTLTPGETGAARALAEDVARRLRIKMSAGVWRLHSADLASMPPLARLLPLERLAAHPALLIFERRDGDVRHELALLAYLRRMCSGLHLLTCAWSGAIVPGERVFHIDALAAWPTVAAPVTTHRPRYDG